MARILLMPPQREDVQCRIVFHLLHVVGDHVVVIRLLRRDDIIILLVLAAELLRLSEPATSATQVGGVK